MATTRTTETVEPAPEILALDVLDRHVWERRGRLKYRHSSTCTCVACQAGDTALDQLRQLRLYVLPTVHGAPVPEVLEADVVRAAKGVMRLLHRLQERGAVGDAPEIRELGLALGHVRMRYEGEPSGA
jgi:hypothetical protein